MASLHPNAVKSPTTDFQALGIGAGDVLEIEDGPNAGNYVIRVAIDKVLFLDQVLPSEDAGPVTANIRKNEDKMPTLTAAVVVSQPVFNAGVSIFTLIDMNVV